MVGEIIGRIVWRIVERTLYVPKVHGLGSNGTVPELGEASGLSSARGGVHSSVSIALEEWPEGAEDAGAGAERHVDFRQGSCVWRTRLV